MSQKLLEIIARAESGQSDIADGVYLLQTMRKEIDRLGDMIDNLPPVNLNIKTVISGAEYQFADVDQMATWIAEEMQYDPAAIDLRSNPRGNQGTG